MRKRTLLTARQIEVLRLRKGGLTQDKVARILGTTRENVSIIERNAFHVIEAAKSTLEAFESLDAGSVITIPERTPIFDIPRIVLVRGDVLGVKVKTTEDDILAMVKSRGKIRGHHLSSPMTIRIMPDGTLSQEEPSSLAEYGQSPSDVLDDLTGPGPDKGRVRGSGRAGK